MIKLTKKSQFKDGMIVIHKHDFDPMLGYCVGCIQKVSVSKFTGLVKLFLYRNNNKGDCGVLIGGYCHTLDLKSFTYKTYEDVVTGILTIGDI